MTSILEQLILQVEETSMNTGAGARLIRANTVRREKLGGILGSLLDQLGDIHLNEATELVTAMARTALMARGRFTQAKQEIVGLAGGTHSGPLQRAEAAAQVAMDGSAEHDNSIHTWAEATLEELKSAKEALDRFYEHIGAAITHSELMQNTIDTTAQAGVQAQDNLAAYIQTISGDM
jgi:hypothetical protein